MLSQESRRSAGERGLWRLGSRARWALLGAIPLALLGTYASVLVDVYRVGQRDSSGPADAAIVLGAAQWNGRPSPVFQARLDHAARLWQAGRVRWVLVTGGQAWGDTQAEADVGARYLRTQGLPSSRVLAVPTGENTYVSLEAAAARMRELRLSRALLVSEPYHMKRSLRMARDLGLEAEPAPDRDSPYAHNPLAELHQAAREAAGYLFYVLFGM